MKRVAGKDDVKMKAIMNWKPFPYNSAYRSANVPERIPEWDVLARVVTTRMRWSRDHATDHILIVCRSLATRVELGVALDASMTATQLLVALAAMGDAAGEVTLARAYAETGEEAGKANLGVMATLFSKISKAAIRREHVLFNVCTSLLISELVTLKEARELIALSLQTFQMFEGYEAARSAAGKKE